MLVEFGNANPRNTEGPAVTYMNVPDTYTYKVADSAARLASDLRDHIADALVSNDGITHLPDQEALLAVQAGWRAEGNGQPSWVWSDNEDFAALLGHFFNCPVGRPSDLEETHFTNAGAPGVRPRDAEADAADAVANEPSEE